MNDLMNKVKGVQECDATIMNREQKLVTKNFKLK